MKRLVDIPLSPKSVPFFYGWVVVAVGTLGIVSSAPGQTMGVGPFTESLMEALNLSRMELSIAYGIGTIISGFLITPGGRWLDRVGVRVSVVIVSLLLAASMVLLAQSGAVSTAISRALPAVSATTISIGVGLVGFFALRFMGQGMMTMTGRVMIGKWFDRRRGLALGITGVFVSFGFGMSQLFFNELIEAMGWRQAYFLLAAIVGCGMSVLGFVFYREKPEDFGMTPDGYSAEQQAGHAALPAVRDFTLREAATSFPFWVFTAGLASQGLVITAVTFHIISVAQEAGITKEHAFFLNVPISLILVFSNLLFGWLSDRTKLKYLLLIMMVAQASGTLGILGLGSVVGQVIFVFGFGISGGIFGLLVGVTWPRFYGLAHLGAITGLNMSMLVFATSAAPLLFAASYRYAESYTPGVLFCAALPAVIGTLALRAENPQPEGL